MLWLICLVFVSIVSIMPGNPSFQQFLAYDKLLHLISYAGTAFFPPLFLPTKRLCFLLAALMVLWGVVLEGVQGFSPHRYPSLGDIAANTAGVILGTGVGLMARKWLNRPKSD